MRGPAAQTMLGLFAAAGLAASLENGRAQALLSGRLAGERWAGASESFAYSGILCFDSLPGADHEARGFRTWETAPAGWFRFSAEAGNHTLVFAGAGHFMRPIVLNNVFANPGAAIDLLRLSPRFDFVNLFEGAWDPKPASSYRQTFIARGRSLTSAGFRLATDGVDGAGPKSQNFIVSLHRRGEGTPDRWPQVGPAARVLDVDSGGPKNYVWSAGWNSGEAPLVHGETYAIAVRAENPQGTFQAFWRASPDRPAGCYRVGPEGGAHTGHDLWLAVATDSDGLVIPYNKRVQKTFGEFAGFAARWTQTYVARGRSLAAAVLYAAVGGAQPPLSRQRVAVRVRREGPGGEVCGPAKIAIGNGAYTGDASWGAFGVAYAPGEVPLEPGRRYALEFASLETQETLEGFVNIKGHLSDARPGFNPYRKTAPDTYAEGAAHKNGAEEMPFDLDLQVIEYEFAAADWARAVQGPDLLTNGNMESFEPGQELASDAQTPLKGQSGYRALRRNAARQPRDWKPFAIDPRARHAVMSAPENPANHFACVFAAGGEPFDGGFVQRVEGLSRAESYRLAGRVRASWAADFEHETAVGLDPSGQETDPQAPTIQWRRYPPRHGVFVPVDNEPVRPLTNAVSVWLRARSTWRGDAFAPFRADFDELALRRVDTRPPAPPAP